MVNQIKLILVAICIFCTQIVNAYHVVVINNTDVQYEQVRVTVKPVDFKALYGTYDIGIVGMRRMVSENVGFSYMNDIPVNSQLLASTLSLDITVIAYPMSDGGEVVETIKHGQCKLNISQIAIEHAINGGTKLQVPDVFVTIQKMGADTDLSIECGPIC